MNRRQRRAAAKARRRAIPPVRGSASTDSKLKASLSYHRAGRLAEAKRLYAEILSREPKHVVALQLLGAILAGEGEAREGIDLIEMAIALRPDYAEAHNNLGNALKDQGRLDEAVAAYHKVLELKPGYAEAHNNLGIALKDLGRLDEAVASYHKAVELKPDLAEAFRNLGVALMVQGRLDEAVDSFRQAVAINPDFVEAYYSLAGSQRGAIDTGSMRHLEALLARNRLSADDKKKLHFTLAKAFEEKADADAAFAHYRRGNELQRAAFAGQSLRFDAEAQDRLVARTEAVFTGQFFAERQSFGIASEAPVFVVGMPRSGTTLVEQIAASHPQVHGAGERWEMDVAAHNLADTLGAQAPYPENVAELDEATAARLGEAYLGRLREVAGDAERVIDKLPFNYLRLGLIAVLLPRARVIHCRRDVRDTCLSCYFQNFSIPYPWTTDLCDIGRYHRAYERLMTHWRSVLPRAMLEVDYEDLVADQEGQSRRIIDFLGLRWDPRCLDFHRTQRQVSTASAWQVRRPIYATSVGRWRAYERMLEPLEAGLAGEDGGATK